jgi:hypothetical protein
MSDEQTVDMMAGLNAVVAILEAIRVDVRAIGPVDRVRLASLQWAVDKLAHDLHDADTEIRNARLEVVSARREADDAREARDAARQLHLVECRKYNAEVERRLALEKQVTELTKKAGELPTETAAEPYQWQVGDIIEGSAFTRRRVEEIHDGWVLLQGMGSPLPQFEWERRGWKLHRKASDLPIELPDIPPFTEQQVAEFAAVMEQVSDSVGTNGEGQS